MIDSTKCEQGGESGAIAKAAGNANCAAALPTVS